MLFNKRKILDFILLFLLVLVAGLGVGAKEVKAEKIRINEDRTWEGEEVIVVSDRLIFKAGTKLVVRPGTKVEFRNGGFLEIGGELIIEGTEAEPVVFFRERFIVFYSAAALTWIHDRVSVHRRPSVLPAYLDTHHNRYKKQESIRMVRAGRDNFLLPGIVEIRTRRQ